MGQSVVNGGPDGDECGKLEMPLVVSIGCIQLMQLMSIFVCLCVFVHVHMNDTKSSPRLEKREGFAHATKK